jgi:hypothetical protein
LNSAPDSASLADRIRGGDTKAISAFRELHLRQMTAYCDVACAPELVDEAVGAAFVDFLGRATQGQHRDEELEALLLDATRAAAAARIRVEARQAECFAVPELLAALANHELPGDDRVLREHLEDCPVCQGTRTLTEQAELAFWPEPAAEAVAEPEAVVAPEPVVVAPEPVVAEPEPAIAEPEPLAEPEPAEPEPVAEPEPPVPPPAPAPPPSPEPAPQPPVVVRRRSGGLVGAIRKRVRPPLS